MANLYFGNLCVSENGCSVYSPFGRGGSGSGCGIAFRCMKKFAGRGVGRWRWRCSWRAVDCGVRVSARRRVRRGRGILGGSGGQEGRLVGLG